MGKTFEEWWAKLCLKYIEFGGGTEILHQDFKQVAKEAWNASRQNMTTKDIQYVYDLLPMVNASVWVVMTLKLKQLRRMMMQ